MIVWLTDIHLNFLKQPKAARFFAESLAEEHPEATGVIITGDISTGKLIQKHLSDFAEGWKKPCYFVNGNHDYYDSSFSVVDRKVQQVCEEYPHMHWLNDGWHMHDGAVIIGTGGWYDAYYGNKNSSVELSDFFVISDIKAAGPNHDRRLDAIRKRASYESDKLASMMKVACEESDTIIVCTHVAPYREASWHMGKSSDDDWAPWFSSQSTGMVLDIYAKRYPQKKFIVLCGHSHSPGIYEPHDNMVVYTGKARYGFPDVTGKIDVIERKVHAYDSASKAVERIY